MESVHKGFLFQTSEGRWVLSTEPNLKSCCVGSKAKKSSQIFLEGDFSGIQENTLIMVTGDLQFDSALDRQVLVHAEIVKTGHQHPPIFTLSLCGAALLSVVLFKKLSKKRS